MGSRLEPPKRTRFRSGGPMICPMCEGRAGLILTKKYPQSAIASQPPKMVDVFKCYSHKCNMVGFEVRIQ